MESKKKRIRRTKSEVENAISTAMDRLVEKHGILGITANMLMAEAGIESPVFYNRYGSIDDLIYEYVSEKDFWIAGKLPYKDIEKDGPEEYYVNTLLKLGDMLKESKFTRDTLIWELSSDSEAACKIAGLKEMENEALLVYYSKVFKDTDVDIRTVTAMLIAGIYWLNLHKDKSTFCGIDLNTKADRDKLAKLLRAIVQSLFAGIESGYVDSRTVETARRMAEKGIDPKTISDVLDVSEDDLSDILAMPSGTSSVSEK